MPRVSYGGTQMTDAFDLDRVRLAATAAVARRVASRSAQNLATASHCPSRQLPSCLSYTMSVIHPQLHSTLDSIKYQIKDAFWALSSCVCQQSAKVKINGRTCMSLTLEVLPF